MNEQRSVDEYFAGEETLRPQELIWGVVREPPAPNFGHQSVVTRTTVVLDLHVRAFNLGVVCVSPIDVVLDEERGLIVQPDVIFISRDRVEIVREQVWGAPDLVVEVLSHRTAARDRTTKLTWYRRYGVRECWLLDPSRRTLDLVDLGVPDNVRRLTGDQRIKSSVLPKLDVDVAQFFG